MTKHSDYRLELEGCMKMMQELEGWRYYHIFGVPVDIVGLKIPDYPTIVKTPMDLGTVGKRLENNDYCHAYEFWSDIELVWKNALLYNTEGEIRDWAMELKSISDEKFQDITKISDEDDTPKCGRETRHRLMNTLKGLNKNQFKECFEYVQTACNTALDYQKKTDKTVTLYVHRITEPAAQELISLFQAPANPLNVSEASAEA